MSAQRRNERAAMADGGSGRLNRARPRSAERAGAHAGAAGPDGPAVAPRAGRTPRASAGGSRTPRASTGASRTPSASPAPRAARAGSRITRSPARPATLCFDIGGTGLKASVLDTEGKMLADRVRVPTTYPCPPGTMVDKLVALAAPLPVFDRVSAGFPGVVRSGKVLTAPHFVTTKGPGSSISKELLAAWTGFDLAGQLQRRLNKPVRVANDAELQGWDVVAGEGLEFVVTLGTGVGTALFLDGKLSTHLELAQQPFRKGETYNDQIGDAALRRIGPAKWRRRVREAIENFDVLLHYERLYLGGGNSKVMAGHVEATVTIVDNVAGILGGIKLWESGV